MNTRVGLEPNNDGKNLFRLNWENPGLALPLFASADGEVCFLTCVLMKRKGHSADGD